MARSFLVRQPQYIPLVAAEGLDVVGTLLIATSPCPCCGLPPGAGLDAWLPPPGGSLLEVV